MALLATLVIQLGQRAHCAPVGVLADRRPRLRFPLFVGGFWSVPERLGSPEHPSKPAWHPDFATPRLLLSIRHLKAPFGLRIVSRSNPALQARRKARCSFEAEAGARSRRKVAAEMDDFRQRLERDDLLEAATNGALSGRGGDAKKPLSESLQRRFR
jgi:hypothetical protein